MKVAGEDYDEPAFFFAETMGEERRLVAWFPETEDQKRVFFRLLERMEPRVKYLFKEEPGHESGDSFIRVFGGIDRDDLRSLVDKYEEWFFESGGFQFCYREAEGERNIAYDEPGVFFIYEFESDDREDLLRFGAREKKRELIMNKPHWTKFIRNADEILGDFKAALKEASASFDDEAEPDSPGA